MNIIDEYCKVNGIILNPYSCILNQTDIKNNKNKFYIMQIIDTKGTYNIYIRYGRIGERGTIINETYNDKNEAISFFFKQFKAKTGNTFRTPFIKKNDKYFLAILEEIPKINDIKKEIDENIKDLDDDLNYRLKYFLRLVSNEKMLIDTMIKLNIDLKKMPLGKISNIQLENANNILKQIKNILISLQNDNMNDIINDKINDLSSEYYTLVPYRCGRNPPPLIDNIEKVDKNMLFLEELKNIHITYTIITNNKTTINKLTNIYNQLDSTLIPLDKSSIIFNELEKYIANTHGSTHKCKLIIEDIYEMNKKSDVIYDEYTKNMKNKMLLFHGSPIANWCSIIKNGLLLDPSKLGVKITGKMFGYGIYWANAISKSFNYCGSENTNNTAILAIGEVALDDSYIQYQANYTISQSSLDKLNKKSTWGKGQFTPNNITTIDNIGIPNGILTQNPSTNNYSLLYDEFIIYNSSQYKIKYIVIITNIFNK